ncbi:ABC transporter ATP-binding protein [Allopusillimonas ginsengisoli]|uniref:ABC transporter ATP-binding protein n=1 Tax=Allopusillimonas ginsengisoli TaxID=453575 RepID=UPI0010207732|nr:ABC transporter ATP-binding protein [Allopusillimonas ginsengisoli]TEA76929.1 ABC transporter ATP-binding protein [Allopusillimonas ginsengisoli]
MATACISARSISKTYQTREGLPVNALVDVSIDIGEAEVLAILGASGCGKSTLLRIMAGLDLGFSGDMIVKGGAVKGPGLDRGFVFQDHRLVPWMTVGENVGLGLHRMEKAQRADAIEKKLELVGLTRFRDAYPAQLSGGMAQRVAIARALAHGPDVLLLDEPFGALDALTRVTMQAEVLRIQQQEKLSCVLVTHDIEEAIYLADRILVLSSSPGTVKAVIDVDMPKPRHRASVEFTELREHIYTTHFGTH